MKKSLMLLLGTIAIFASNTSSALVAHFTNDTGQQITISVQENNCVTYVGSEGTHTLPGNTPSGGWKMNLGDRNSGGCSASYMLAWGIYAGSEVDQSKKIGDINFHYQSGWSLKTWQNKTTNTSRLFQNFYICSHSEIKDNSWDDSYVWWQLGAKHPDWDCKAPVN